jgi:2-C-methyl-D-erythritol 4-phosphate cytidylyltransferase
MSVWVVVVAAGSGSRFGRPKQYEMVGDDRVIDRSVAAARAVGEVVVVVAPARVAAERSRLAAFDVTAVVAGGDTRSASVRCGLAAVPPGAAIVLVHDAARPLATRGLFARVVRAVEEGAVAVVPATPVVDSLRARDGGAIDRAQLVVVQTPQGFAAATLREAHRGEPEASDDAALVEAIGGKVVLVPGEATNLKITNPADLVVANALVTAGMIDAAGSREGSESEPVAGREGAEPDAPGGSGG